MSLLSSYSFVGRMPKLMAVVGMVLLLGACVNKPAEQWTVLPGSGTGSNIEPDPPCTQAGYFASNQPSYYYRCVYSAAYNRWLKYVYQCPNNQNFNQATQRCE